MRESLIEKKTCATAKAQGWLVHPKAAVGTRGWPDRTLTKPNRLIFVEFKAPGKKPTKLQAHTHQKLRKQGYDVYVIDSIEAGTALFA
ncbi:MAG: VRR-NUC domain-containing protein [Alphaproteobacteria bacterium]|nr:VRR-NUC domain-containing protein [Alphaproteobacteria bacterium]